MKTALGQVLHGQASGVIADLEAQRKPRRGQARKRLDRVYTDLDGNRHRMAYDAYLEAGFPIATGVIEGACRHLVKDRMERSGMRWTVPGAHAMLQLRSVALSNLWEPFMDDRIHSELTHLYGEQAAKDDRALPSPLEGSAQRDGRTADQSLRGALDRLQPPLLRPRSSGSPGPSDRSGRRHERWRARQPPSLDQNLSSYPVQARARSRNRLSHNQLQQIDAPHNKRVTYRL
ncbi:MAG: hypothetical protein VBE63_19575 [Lamprobacter sp.]|uniref:hypothetical protein n=1 Tax=Lamprobacter sp. TaxID=3100796 RepID=UPI002B263D1C|nr:hypothetical protein [Lamprobacter sp.]MEA3642118.1 hypothetical protein [Lamprobacter sp.]